MSFLNIALGITLSFATAFTPDLSLGADLSNRQNPTEASTGACDANLSKPVERQDSEAAHLTDAPLLLCTSHETSESTTHLPALKQFDASDLEAASLGRPPQYWVVQGLRFLAGYVAGKAIDKGIDAIIGFLSGAQQQAGQVSAFSTRSDQRDLSKVAQTLSRSEGILRQQGSVRAKQRAIQNELARLEQSVGSLSRFIRQLERRIEDIESINRIQFERIQSIEAKLAALQRNDARQDEAIADVTRVNARQDQDIRENTRKNAEQDRRINYLEERRRRADMFAELSGIFQSTYDFAGGEHAGIHGAIQGNATDYLGIFVAYDYAPHYAREPFVVIDDAVLVGTPFWQNHTITAGFKVSLTPPKLPFNIQAGAGGGILIGSLRTTTTGKIFAPKTSSRIGGSTQPVATLSADVALGKADWQIVPFFSGQHMLLFDDLAYSDISSLGRRMWNIGVGLRLRGHIQ